MSLGLPAAQAPHGSQPRFQVQRCTSNGQSGRYPFHDPARCWLGGGGRRSAPPAATKTRGPSAGRTSATWRRRRSCPWPPPCRCPRPCPPSRPPSWRRLCRPQPPRPPPLSPPPRCPSLRHNPSVPSRGSVVVWPVDPSAAFDHCGVENFEEHIRKFETRIS